MLNKKKDADGVQQSQFNQYQFNQFLDMQALNRQTDPEHSPFATGPTDPPSPAAFAK
jgi:hypothetical protein